MFRKTRTLNLIVCLLFTAISAGGPGFHYAPIFGLHSICDGSDHDHVVPPADALEPERLGLAAESREQQGTCCTGSTSVGSNQQPPVADLCADRGHAHGDFCSVCLHFASAKVFLADDSINQPLLLFGVIVPPTLHDLADLSAACWARGPPV